MQSPRDDEWVETEDEERRPRAGVEAVFADVQSVNRRRSRRSWLAPSLGSFSEVSMQRQNRAVA